MDGGRAAREPSRRRQIDESAPFAPARRPGLFCAEVDGVGKFVKSLNVLSSEEACELNPKLKADSAQVAAK